MKRFSSKIGVKKEDLIEREGAMKRRIIEKRWNEKNGGTGRIEEGRFETTDGTPQREYVERKEQPRQRGKKLEDDSVIDRTISIVPRKKTSLGESLAESHVYNPIRDSGETLGEREKSRQKSHWESRLDSWWDSWQDSWRDFSP